MLFASSVSLPPDFKGTSITLALTDHSADRECIGMLPLLRSLGVPLVSGTVDAPQRQEVSAAGMRGQQVNAGAAVAPRSELTCGAG